MQSYRILVVDDDLPANQRIFDSLFSNCSLFTPEFAKNWEDFCGRTINKFDAILLDVNLSNWGVTLSETFNLISDKAPVILMSQYWSDSRTHTGISDALAAAKNISLAGTLVLNNLAKVSKNTADGDEYVNSLRAQLSVCIAKHRRRSPLNLNDDSAIRILHLSDPQYGDPSQDNLSFLVEKEIPKFILNDLKKTVHFVAITGDITYSGQPEQFELAKQGITTLLNRFIPSTSDWKERVLIVPGNHDVNLRLCCADTIEYKPTDPPSISIIESSKNSHRRFGLQGFRDFASDLTGNDNWRKSSELLWANDAFRHLGIRFFMMNSAASIDHNNPKKYEIPTSALESLAASCSTEDNIFGIALSHHGPISPTIASVDSLSNWEQIRLSFNYAKIRLFLHGHGHAWHSDIIPLTGNTPPRSTGGAIETNETIRAMAPTTHLNNKKRPPEEHRGFNLITLLRKNGKVNRVEIESYALPSDGTPYKNENSPIAFYV